MEMYVLKILAFNSEYQWRETREELWWEVGLSEHLAFDFIGLSKNAAFQFVTAVKLKAHAITIWRHPANIDN